MSTLRTDTRAARRDSGVAAPPAARRRVQRTPGAAQRGAALIIVLLLSFAALGLGLLAANSARTELRIAHNDVLDTRALNVAEAGLNAAYKRIAARGNFNDELANNGTGACTANGVGNAVSGLAGIGNAKSLASDGRCYRFVAFGGAATDGYYVRTEDNYDETLGGDAPLLDTDSFIYVVAVGVVSSAERIVVGKLRRTSAFPLLGTDEVELTGGAIVGGGAGVHTNANMKVEGGSRINGPASAGGSIAISGGGQVTGTVTNSAPTPSFPAVPDCGPPYSSAAGITGGIYTQSDGKLEVPGGTVTLAPGTYCFGMVVLNSGGQLRITGPTTINLTGQWDASFGSVSNTTSDPFNLQINSSGPGQIKLSGGASAYYHVYGPATDIEFTGSSTFWGSVVGKKIIVNGASQINYMGAGGAVLSDWHEVQN